MNSENYEILDVDSLFKDISNEHKNVEIRVM